MAKLKKFDAAEYLDSPEAVAAYLTEAFATRDPKYIAHAIDTAARSIGVAKIAAKTKIGRNSLYKSFDGKTAPAFDTVQKVLGAMDLEIAIKPKPRAKQAAVA